MAYNDYEKDVQRMAVRRLQMAVGDYAKQVWEAISEDVIDDVSVSSAVADEGKFAVMDVMMAIGRAMLSKLGVSWTDTQVEEVHKQIIV